MKFNEKIREYNNQLERPFTFIQAGCNDGFMADPIHNLIIEYGWHGLLVDADSCYIANAYDLYAKETKKLVEDSRLNFFNAGIVTLDEKNGSNFRKFYSIVPDAIRPKLIMNNENSTFWLYGDKLFPVPDHYKDVDPIRNNCLDYLQGIGSFDYEFVLMHIDNVTKKQDVSGNISREIFTTDKKEHYKFVKTHFIPCMTVNDLYSISNFDHVDLLQTDLETWDVKIMEDIAEFSFKPKFIHFEAPGGISKALYAKFISAGYSIEQTEDSRDQLAILK